VPLSEEELRALEQMERALSAEDPKFASALRGTALRRSQRRRAVGAGIALVGGVALLMAGVVSSLWVVGIVGFLVMLASTTVGLAAVRGEQAMPKLHRGEDDHEPRDSFVKRVEQRFRRRKSGW